MTARILKIVAGSALFAMFHQFAAAQIESTPPGQTTDVALLQMDPVQMASEPFSLSVPPDSVAWHCDLSLWLWAAGLEGTIGGHGIEADVDASFIDVVDDSDSLIGIAGRLELGYKKWTAYVDGVYDKIGVDHVSGPLGLADIDVTTELGIVDFGLMYRLSECPASDGVGGAPRVSTVDAYVGGRYQTVSLELDPANFPSVDGDKDWIDPIVGVKVGYPFGNRWVLRVWGDIGGFDVASDLTWSATGLIGYQFRLFGLDTELVGGYRAIGTDYSSGSGNNKFVWDVVMHGPIIGLTFDF